MISSVPSLSTSIEHTSLSSSGSVTFISKVTLKGTNPSGGVGVNFSITGGLFTADFSTFISTVFDMFFEPETTKSFALYKPSSL